MSFTITSALRWWRCECPDELAWSVDDEPLTYRELMDWSGRVGAFLQSRGVKPGDRVTMMARNTIEYAVLAIALVRIGAIGTPINFRSTARELAESCEDFEPVVVKDIIISGGLNISAAEVERVIRDMDGVEEVAVIKANDDKFGETPLAIIYGDNSRLSPEAVVAHCDKHLSNYKVPRYVVIEPEPLPRLPSGKISKQALREKYKDADKQLEKVR